MPQPTPEESGNPPYSGQARRLSEFTSSEEFQSLTLSQKFARLRKFMIPKSSFTPEDFHALAETERAKRLKEFQSTEEFRKFSGRARRESLRRFVAEVYDKMPKSELEKRFDEYLRSEETQERRRALNQAEERLHAIRLLSSAQEFLRRLGPRVPRELIEIAREEQLNMPDIGDLSPTLQDALKRVGWDEPQPIREY